MYGNRHDFHVLGKLTLLIYVTFIHTTWMVFREVRSILGFMEMVNESLNEWSYWTIRIEVSVCFKPLLVWFLRLCKQLSHTMFLRCHSSANRDAIGCICICVLERLFNINITLIDVTLPYYIYPIDATTQLISNPLMCLFCSYHINSHLIFLSH